MAGVFSLVSSSGNGHRLSQSAFEGRETLPSNAELEGTAIDAGISHGIENEVKFKPVEHPISPLDSEQPVKCPLPEPSILNDGRIWKQRLSASVQRRPSLPVMQETSSSKPEAGEPKMRSAPANRPLLPSISAPEHHILKLLEECNAAGG